MAKETRVLRKFGINETYQLAMYLIDQYRGTIFSCRYEIPPWLAPIKSQTELATVVMVAVVDTIMRHPMMQVGVMNATSKTPSWIQLESLDLTQHVKWLYIGEHNDFEQIVQETARTQLDEYFPDLSIKQPGWKITVLRQGNAPSMELLLTWNHNHFDGVGAKVFHEDLLEMLKNVEKGVYERTGLESNILKLPQAPPLLPDPIESVRSLPVDLKSLVKAFWEETRPQFLNRDVSHATWCPIRTFPYKSQSRAFFVNGASLLAILDRCRQNETTITGLINGLLLIAYSLRLDSKAAPAFQSSTMVDHRRNLPPPPPDASEGRDLSTDLQRELWAVSAQNRLEIISKLEAGLQNDIVGLFKYVTDWQKTMKDMAKKRRQFSWVVTNVGVMNGETSIGLSTTTTQAPTSSDDTPGNSQKWSISRAGFGLSAEVPAAAIEFACVSVAGRGMCINSSWADCAVDATFGEHIMGDLERWITQLARQP
ncbi:hypothetical protein BGAL_0213g00040 [Botrytis galanthina]|uniref:Condensation domain-containing protein n=1 Tax=Botrytis galanthina TaxID=278940 RepID=A0A4S8QV06_9HELO|nr:hypothetical protein BGAL_0213g00040 [Botrytis galanthina]